MDDATSPRRSRSAARAWLALYAALLAGIALWPAPIDSGLGPFLARIGEVFPLLTYTRIEFAANILLFVPLGLLLAMILPRTRYLVIPLSIVTTVTVESIQAIALDLRTPSVMDIVANTTGACIGLVLAAFIESLRRGAVRRPTRNVVELLD